MNNNNGTDIFGLDDNLGGGMNEGWWWIGDGRNSQRDYQMFFGCMRKEVEIGGDNIKEGGVYQVEGGYLSGVGRWGGWALRRVR